tara:strand:+ start:170 stop:2788 length:2619 start_codon:yes stop_codon:yes gene_type:complete
MDLVSQNLLLASSGKKSTFIDDVFSTYLYEGNSTARSITTGIDMTKGGLTWIKDRDNAYNHVLQDTVRGAGATTKLASNDNWAQNASDNAIQWSGYISAFNNNGFSLDKYGTGSIDWANVNKSGDSYTSWNFRKQKGFFDVVTYTGNGSVRTISHSLGCVPGLIIVKGYSNTNSWYVYHRDIGSEKYLRLNGNDAVVDQSWFMNDTAPTASEFSLGTSSNVNGSGQSYVAYLFAGGESTAATARSLAFGGSYDYIQIEQANSDFNFGTGDFTIEGWLKPNSTSGVQTFLNLGSANPAIGIKNNKWWYYNSTVGQSYAGTVLPEVGQWTHYAISRSSGTTRLFINGNPKSSFSDSHNYGTQAISIGGRINGTDPWNGSMSNVRVVKGTAVYTSSFRPSYEPLTNITNTVLLCCNDSSASGSTVTPDTIKVNNQVTASTDSPFDDIGGFKFGEGGDQNIIKTGSYTGNGSATGPEVYLGWEPSFIILKNSEKTENWLMWDSMRGIVTGRNDARLFPNLTTAESSPGDFIDLTSTGFKIKDNGGDLNEPNDEIIYIAIRRPDGYVGKPAEAGTNAFAMTYGVNSGVAPMFITPNVDVIDFKFYKNPTSGGNWYTSARIVQTDFWYTNVTGGASTDSNEMYDYMNGMGSWTNNGTAVLTYLWKRHAGFDVVTYKTPSSIDNFAVNHSLGRIPEMIWIKHRNVAVNWTVYHKGLNGGTNPEQYGLHLNTTSAEVDDYGFFADIAPNATTFQVGYDGTTGGYYDGSGEYIAMLFASVDGISKVGYYDGTGSTGNVITTGFTPRFLIIKKANGANSWFVYDSVRGLGAGADPYLQLENSNAQDTSGADVFATSSTGFTINQNYDSVNASGGKYIYYAHA